MLNLIPGLFHLHTASLWLLPCVVQSLFTCTMDNMLQWSKTGGIVASFPGSCGGRQEPGNKARGIAVTIRWTDWLQEPSLCVVINSYILKTGFWMLAKLHHCQYQAATLFEFCKMHFGCHFVRYLWPWTLLLHFMCFRRKWNGHKVHSPIRLCFAVYLSFLAYWKWSSIYFTPHARLETDILFMHSKNGGLIQHTLGCLSSCIV